MSGKISSHPEGPPGKIRGAFELTLTNQIG